MVHIVLGTLLFPFEYRWAKLVAIVKNCTRQASGVSDGPCIEAEKLAVGVDATVENVREAAGAFHVRSIAHKDYDRMLGP